MSSTTGSVSLTPPSQGTHQGVVAFQDRTSSAPNSITGNGNMKIKGTIYTPAAPLSITANNRDRDDDGAPKDKIGSQIIVQSLTVSGSGGFSVNSGSGTPVRTIQLIE